MGEDMEARMKAEDQERLKRSRFLTFIYLMEDLRNGYFKIGRSANPGTRERTLQSEAPQVVMRLSIPAAEEHEKELHHRFSSKRIRGEWFALTANDVVSIVSFLTTNGDCSRTSVDYQWLGKTFFSSQATPPIQ